MSPDLFWDLLASEWPYVLEIAACTVGMVVVTWRVISWSRRRKK